MAAIVRNGQTQPRVLELFFQSPWWIQVPKTMDHHPLAYQGAYSEVEQPEFKSVLGAGITGKGFTHKSQCRPNPGFHLALNEAVCMLIHLPNIANCSNWTKEKYWGLKLRTKVSGTWFDWPVLTTSEIFISRELESGAKAGFQTQAFCSGM